MAKNDKRTLMPRLRFPKFKREPEWGEKQLSTAIRLVSGVHLSPHQYGTEDEVPYFTGPSDFTNDIHSVAKWTAETTSVAKEYDTLITVKGSGVGELWYLTIPVVAMGRQLMAVRPQGCSSRFVHYFLLTRRSCFKNFASGNLIPGLSRGDILDMVAPFPSSLEQQRIAECLTSLDDLIAAQEQKVESLRAHKTGLMQQLFPREGETLPSLRFPEFRDAGEWEEKNAGSMFGNRTDKGEEGLPIYSVTVSDGMVRRDSFDRDFYDIKDAARNKKACKNDIAYNTMRMWQGALGVAPEDCLVSPAYIILSPHRGVVPRFFEYLLKLHESILLLTSHSRGLTKDRLRLYYDDFARILLRCPKRAEQQRIADCLSSLDNRIVTEADKLAMLKKHKQGLMQQLFPSPEGTEA